ncbi:MFS transporter [Bacillus marasmi]|uniref:MFS transporter n=1 Tax=Bacillus marasmi TaxID=1926279 RepID=UPI0011CAD12D|nr:MFS transporter [Bacillus marasmi]
MEQVDSLFVKVFNQKEKKSMKKRWAIVSLASIPLVMTLGNSMLIPVLPAIERELGISSFQSSMILTVYSIVAILLIPIAGFLSDYIGRKRVIIPSLIIAGIGGVISGYVGWKLSDAYWLILVGRALQGVGAAGAAPIVLPLVGDMFHSDDEVSSALGVIETSNTLGKVLSPILGAFLAGIIWFIPFFAFPVFCTISVFMIVFLVKTPKKSNEPINFKQFIVQTKEVFANNGRWLNAVFIIGCTLMFVLFGVLFYLSDVLEKNYHVTDVKKGLILAVPLGALCLASYITGKKIKEDKVMMKWLIFSGIIMLTVASFSLKFTNSLWFMISIFVLCGIGIGISLPCLDALITEGIEKAERGTITSLYSSMRFIGVAAGPPVIAILMKYPTQWIFYLFTAISLLTALFALWAIKPDES